MESFKNFRISNNLISHLAKRGINSPTPIQSQVIDPILEGKDVIGRAETGSGKTLAFMLPIFENLNQSVKEVQTLILTPTRELAIQVSEEAQKLGEVKEIKTLLAYGGRDIEGQLNKLKGVQLIVATPGRLLDHLRRGTINLNRVKNIVIDEADQMLLMGFKNEVEEIMKHTGRKNQVLCFSATINSDVKKLAYRYTSEPVVVEIDKSSDENIEEYLVESTDRWKLDALCEVLNDTNPFMGIIFCRTKARVDKLEERLDERGYNCQKIHSDIPQAKREKIMKAFRNAEIQYLIATDVASRGLHIDGITHVYNYDIPEETESYTHRIGRTGRAGQSGKTYLFVTPKGERELEKIEEIRGRAFKRIEIRKEKDVMCTNPSLGGKYKKRINTTPNKFKKR